MARIKNPWVGYLERSYLDIKNSLLRKLGDLVPEVTDHSESNLLVIIISMFAGITEQLNYYIDNMAREAFITTARQYSSVVKHTRLVDYRIKARIPASASLTVDLLGNRPTTTVAEAFPTYTPFTIPAGTEFSTENGIKFISLEDTMFTPPRRIANFNIVQKTKVSDEDLGQTTGAIGQIYPLGNEYVHNSLELEIGGEVWERKDTLGRSTPTDKHYIVDISSNRLAYIIFGDNINGLNPPANQDIVANYYISEGEKGNVDINTIVKTPFDFSPYISEPDYVKITNTQKAVAGSDYEGIEKIRRSVPLSLRTLDRAVTRQDYIDITKLAPGVDKATLHFECGKTIEIYISPNGGGIASDELLNTTTAFINERKMVTTFVNVYPAGESYVQLVIDATARFRRDGLTTKEDIIKAITGRYSYENSDVNRKIRKSDIIALVDNVESVDYLELKEIYLKPYMRPFEHTRILDHIFRMREGLTQGSPGIISWELRYYNGVMKLFKEGVFSTDIPLNTEVVEPSNTFSINILPNGYTDGMVWRFKTYPYNQNIELADFTVPVIREQDIELIVNEQLILN